MSSPMPEREADVVVIGAGPAGIAAACSAAGGRRVVLLDSSVRPGGQIWRHRSPDSLGPAARRWLHRLQCHSVCFEGRHTVTEVERGRVACTAPSGAVTFRPETIVLATGARERYLPFPGWTLPGVLGVGGLQALIKEGATVAGLRILLAGSGPLLLPVAAACADAGAELVGCAEQASATELARFAAGLWRDPRKLLDAAMYRFKAGNCAFRTASWVRRVERTDAGLSVELVTPAGMQRIACDLLATGFGLVPSTELAQQAGCAVADGRIVINDRQETTMPGILAAGESTGIGGADAALIEGRIAGAMAAGRGMTHELPLAERAGHQRFAAALERHFALRPEVRGLATPDTIVCRCEDVRLGSLDPAWGSRYAKLMTRTGMGPCQGRVCGPALEALYGWETDACRIPAFPVPLGRLLEHCRTTNPTEE